MADEVDSKYEAFVADVRPTFGEAVQQRKDWAMSDLPVSQASIDGLSALVDKQEATIADLRSQLSQAQAELDIERNANDEARALNEQMKEQLEAAQRRIRVVYNCDATCGHCLRCSQQ